MADEEPQYSSECDLGDGQCLGGGTAGVDTDGAPPSTDGTTIDGFTSADTTTTADSTSSSDGTDSGGVVVDRVRSR